MPFNGIEQQKIILFLTIFNIVNIIYNIANYERIVTVSIAGSWIMAVDIRTDHSCVCGFYT